MLSINKHFIKTLMQANQFSYYIHLKDHNKKINPEKNKLSLSFMNPKVVTADAPQEQSFAFNLRRKTQKQLQRKMFQEYKQKVLKGQIDQDEQIEIDPLWGQGQKPKHYYQNLSKSQLMRVSHPQNSDFIPSLSKIHQNYFNTTLAAIPTIQQLKNMKPSQLVNAAVYARLNKVYELDFWHNLEKTIGNRFYQLNVDELISLCFALKFGQKRGTPRIHKIIGDLLEGDLPTFSHQQLISLFYSLRHSKIQGAELQNKILARLQHLYSEMNFQQKVDWLFTYTISRRPQNFRPSEQKMMNQGLMKGHQVIFGLNFSNQLSKQLTSIQQASNIIYSLAKLKATNTQFITSEIICYLKQNIQSLKGNVQASAKLLYYFQEVEGGSGVYDEELFNNLIETVTEADNFATLNKVQQLRSVYAIWNYNLMTDEVFELYKNIQIEADSTTLYYFCQIQLSRSSQRQWQVLRCLADLEYIPMPYYQAIRRFYHHMRVSVPDWDLTSIQQKLKNTEYYFDVTREQDRFYNISVYKNLQKYFKFTQQNSPFEHTIPIDNLELTQFGNATHQVSVDVVNESAFVPGTDSLTQSYRNKIRSLANIGWKHAVIREKQLRKLPASQQIKQIIFAFVPYVQEQQAVIANRDYYRAEEIQALGIQNYWDGMTAEEAEGYRNNPEEYAKKIAQLAEKERKLSEQIAKVQ